MKISRRSIKNTLLGFLRQGITPRKLALTCALGVVLGLFPVFGTTTLLCLGAAIVWRLNIPLIQLVNYVTAPIQLLMIVPFIKMGATLFGYQSFSYNGDEFLWMLRNDFWTLFQETGVAIVMGIGVWTVLSVPLFFLLFFLGLWLFGKWKTWGQRELKSQ
jgi:hypothetical protein